MSHVTTIKFNGKWNLATLKAMCAAEGWDFIEGQKTFSWYGQHVGDYPLPDRFTQGDMGKCNHAINIPGAKYQIGVIEKEGKLHLLWDFYDAGGLQQALGKDAGLLTKAYTLAETRRKCHQARHRFKETRHEGHTEIRIPMN